MKEEKILKILMSQRHLHRLYVMGRGEGGNITRIESRRKDSGVPPIIQADQTSGARQSEERIDSWKYGPAVKPPDPSDVAKQSARTV
jgi:hypothetical protein